MSEPIERRGALPEPDDRAPAARSHRIADPSKPPRFLRDASYLVIAVLLIGMVADLYYIYVSLDYIDFVDQLLNGRIVSLFEAQELDDRIRNAALISIAAYLLAAIAYVFWFHRAYTNLIRTGVPDLAHRSAAAIFSWFIPFAAYVWPKRIANDIWRAGSVDADVSDGGWKERPLAAVLNWWWAAWVTGTVLTYIATRIFFNAGRDLDTAPTRRAALDALEREQTANYVELTGAAITLVAAVLAIIVVRRITARQDELTERLLNETASEPAPPASQPPPG